MGSSCWAHHLKTLFKVYLQKGEAKEPTRVVLSICARAVAVLHWAHQNCLEVLVWWEVSGWSGPCASGVISQDNCTCSTLDLSKSSSKSGHCPRLSKETMKVALVSFSVLHEA